MVQSGLKEETMGMSTTAHPHVSQYRLAGHLGMAFTLYSGMFWQALSHLTNPAQVSTRRQLVFQILMVFKFLLNICGTKEPNYELH